jgi:hypothetical protein
MKMAKKDGSASWQAFVQSGKSSSSTKITKSTKKIRQIKNAERNP